MKQRFVPYRIYVCGLPPPDDGAWHELGYVDSFEHVCNQRGCEYLATWVRTTKRRRYACATHRIKADARVEV